MKGKFYGIGVGPGDPELLTLKGKRILGLVDVVAVPESRSEKGSLALEIVKEHLKKDVEKLILTFPMIKDEVRKTGHRKQNSIKIKELVDLGKSVAFLTLGDPMLYSTYIYILEFLREYDIEIETVPGIPSFCAISSSLNLPLVKQSQNLGIISLDKETDLEGFLYRFDTLVIMKPGTDKDRLAEVLNNHKNFDVVIASKSGTNKERVSYNIDDLKNDIPYLTTVVLKKR